MLFVEAIKPYVGSAHTRQELTAPGLGEWVVMRKFKRYTVLEQITNEMVQESDCLRRPKGAAATA